MNKKFSTLVASLLLAGAWMTMDAAVVKVDPAIGGKYVVGIAGEAEGTVSAWTGTDMTLDEAGAVGAESDMNIELVAVAGEDGLFYVKSGSNYLSFDAAQSWDKSISWASGKVKIKFALNNNGELTYSATENGMTGGVDGTLFITEDGVGFNYPNYDKPADAKALEFFVYNDDVTFEGETLELQDEAKTGEYYVIAATDAQILTDDGAGKVTAVAMTADEAKIDNVLWKITEGKAADGKTITYKLTNKASGKDLVVENRDNFIVAGSAASFTLGVGNGQLLAVGGSGALEVGTAVSFGIYKSPVVKLNSTDLNAMLSNGFNMTIKKTETGTETIEGLEAFAGDLVAVQEGVTKFQIQNGEKFIGLDKAGWAADNTGVAQRKTKFVLVDDADDACWFEFTQYTGTAADLIKEVTVYETAAATDMYGQLFISSLEGKHVLTATPTLYTFEDVTETLPYITLGDDNIIDPAEFLQNKYAVIKQLNGEGADDDLFVVAAGCGEDQGITVAETVTNDLEKQWLISYDKETKQYTLTNRENTKVKRAELAYTLLRDNSYAGEGYKTDDIYVYNGEEYEIKFYDLDDAKNYYDILAEDAAALAESSYEISYWSTIFDGYAKVSANKDNVAFVGQDATPFEFKATSTANYEPKAPYTYWDGTEFKTENDALKAPIYTFASLAAGTDNGKYVVNAGTAASIVIRKSGDHWNLMTVEDGAMTGKIYVGNNDSYIYDVDCMYAADKNSLFKVESNNRPEYRRLGATIEDGLNDMEGDLNVLKFFRTNDENQFLYENTGNKNANNGEACLNFLGETNLADKPASAQLPFLVDTAFIRDNTRKPLYMLAVRSEYTEAGEEIIPCPEHPEGGCEHTTKVETPAYRTGDYLVVLDDSTSYDQAIYQTNVRLAFVPAKHIADTLVILNDNRELVAKDSIVFSNAAGKQVNNTLAAFAFKLVDPAAVDEGKAEFIIEAAPKAGTDAVRYLRVHNTVPVLVTEKDQAAVFDVVAAEEGEEATANEGVEAATVKVIATEGGVIVKGAAGKKVAISNVLGQTIANTVIASDEATISAPAGVVVVAVEGEAAVKAIVK